MQRVNHYGEDPLSWLVDVKDIVFVKDHSISKKVHMSCNDIFSDPSGIFACHLIMQESHAALAQDHNLCCYSGRNCRNLFLIIFHFRGHSQYSTEGRNPIYLSPILGISRCFTCEESSWAARSMFDVFCKPYLYAVLISCCSLFLTI